MSDIKNKIAANDRTLNQVLSDQKYTIDYFQREYLWEEKHIEQLISDLTSAFLNEYNEKDLRGDVENYNCYYMGPFVISNRDNKKDIIDGQQRLTSLTLLLIYLNNFLKSKEFEENLSSLIFSEKYGVKSFNLEIEERENCLQKLFEEGYCEKADGDSPSTINMIERYQDIENFFPNEDIDGETILHFIDWLREKVILVEIMAYSSENAYSIFETMNDRGLKLTPTEMLKGYILSKIDDTEMRNEHNSIWKENIEVLQSFEETDGQKTEDQKFIQAWLRAKYADTIRQAKQGSQNEDFERIGARFHNWFKENLEKIDLDEENSKAFSEFLKNDFNFYFKAYKMILECSKTFDESLEHVYYINDWGIGASLSYPLLLAPLEIGDNDETIKIKMNMVAKYIEMFAVRRSVNHKKFGLSSIRYTMCLLVKEIREKSLEDLKNILENKLNSMKEEWDGILNFTMNSQNKKFAKFLLSRISAYIDKLSGGSGLYDDYYRPNGKPFEIEHIWADNFGRHKDEFQEKADFDNCRNRLGGLVLLPRGANQSYSDKPYAEKLKHYVKENLLVKSLTPICYENNPNFVNMVKDTQLNFRHHEVFLKADVEERTSLYCDICKLIWKEL